MKELKKRIEWILKEKLLQYGFQKKSNLIYSRMQNDTIQELVFAFSSNGWKGVRFLSYTAMFYCPDINELASKYEEDVGCIGLNIGSLMPEQSYKEWKFTFESSEEYIRYALDEVIFTVVHYAIPYLESYSRKEEIAYGLETGALHTIYEQKERWLPIYYMICGKVDYARTLIDEAVKRRALSFPLDEYKVMQAIYGEEAIPIPPNKSLESYLPFAEKFKKMVASENT